MFKNFNFATGILALLLFGYAQHQGWNMFDNVANPGKGCLLYTSDAADE